jgi:hypothetical protein
MPKSVKTRAQWAAKIRSNYKRGVEAFVKTGLTLLAAKKALPHGAFLEMVKRDLPFTPSTAQRLMKIGTDPRLTNTAHGQHLPKAWRTLHELTKLDDKAFKEALLSGAIHPEMTRNDAERLAAPSSS